MKVIKMYFFPLRFTILNSGEPLKMIDEKTLPKLRPNILHPGSSIVLPSMRYGFWVIPDAGAKACMG